MHSLPPSLAVFKKSFSIPPPKKLVLDPPTIAVGRVCVELPFQDVKASRVGFHCILALYKGSRL